MFAVGAAVASPACRLFDRSEAPLLPMSELIQRRYWIADFNGDAVFIGLDDGECPYALSLICTHKKCTVGYKPELDGFLCPCHKGRYDRYGRVISVKPPRPLDRFALEEREGVVWILNRPPA
ncbi:MAG: Rieske (2Fe-2S) protein [Bacteroidia bacterium]|nr:Rieske (2Fe-2S) protein [Bacteroidia bacterium]